MSKPFVWIFSENPSETDKKHAIRELVFTLSLSIVLIVLWETIYAIDSHLLFKVYKESHTGWDKFHFEHLTTFGYVLAALIVLSEIMDVVIVILWLIYLRTSRITKAAFALVCIETLFSITYWFLLMTLGKAQKDVSSIFKTMSLIGLGASLGLVVMMYNRILNHIFI